MKNLMLVMTTNCNLNCKYCYEDKNTNADMSFDLAKKIIDQEFAHSEEKEYCIFFFGGEPLIRFDLIKNVYSYIEQFYYDYRVQYSMTTNGTLLHGEILTWLSERSARFKLIISYDGTPQMQDLNRVDWNGEGSSRLINLDEIIQVFPKAVAKMTIGPDSFENFAEGIIFLAEKGFLVKANFASGVDFQLSEKMDVCKQNMLKLIEYYSVHENIHLPFFLDLNLVSILIGSEVPFSYCDAGINKRCYDYKGDCYPCQGLMPMATSNENFKNESFTDNNIFSHSNCRTCSFVRICRTCYAANQKETGNVWTPSDQTCFLNKICMLSSARIQYNRIKKKDNNLWTVQDHQIMRAVLKIAQELDGVF